MNVKSIWISRDQFVNVTGIPWVHHAMIMATHAGRNRMQRNIWKTISIYQCRCGWSINLSFLTHNALNQPSSCILTIQWIQRPQVFTVLCNPVLWDAKQWILEMDLFQIWPTCCRGPTKNSWIKNVLQFWLCYIRKMVQLQVLDLIFSLTGHFILPKQHAPWGVGR